MRKGTRANVSALLLGPSGRIPSWGGWAVPGSRPGGSGAGLKDEMEPVQTGEENVLYAVE